MTTDTTVVALLKGISDQLNELKKDQTVLTQRVSLLEKADDEQPPPSPKTDGIFDHVELGQSDHGLFEKSDEESEDEMDLQFQSRVTSTAVGPPVNDKLAGDINDSLLLGDDGPALY